MSCKTEQEIATAMLSHLGGEPDKINIDIDKLVKLYDVPWLSVKHFSKDVNTYSICLRKMQTFPLLAKPINFLHLNGLKLRPSKDPQYGCPDGEVSEARKSSSESRDKWHLMVNNKRDPRGSGSEIAIARSFLTTNKKQERKKDMLMSFKRPEWPIRPNKKLQEKHSNSHILIRGNRAHN
mgnify:FL=1